jgi:flagellar L-ring protein precursor FlgH
MMTTRFTSLCILLVVLGASVVSAQSSSLYAQKTKPAMPQPVTGPDGRFDRLSQPIAQASYSAVPLPEPRGYALHDLITIVIRESIENDISSSTDTKKSSSVNGSVVSFPSIASMLELRPRTSETTNNPAVNLSMDTKFKGEGSHKRTDTFTTRVTARIIDIKPNGTLVLEARKRIVDDNEDVTLVLTGTCRKEDIESDNTILSTQIYDLFLRKQTAGEMKKASEKGLLTRILDTVFNF